MHLAEPYEELFATAAMTDIFAATTHVRQMLRFEAALARAEADVGIIPQEAADAIAAACNVDLFDVAALYREAAATGTPAIPLVRMLTAQVSEKGRAFVHFGATSQDAIDTALVLQMRDGLDVLVKDLLGVCEGSAKLAEQYRDAPMAGRTLLQHAVPITFGLKAARWLAQSTRQVEALRAQRNKSLTLQFGGAAGTLAALGDAGMTVAQRLADELRLPLPDLPWHAERDRMATIAATLGVTAGAMSKIASDVVLLAQTEIGEVSESSAPGKGGSSAMPQKHNPVDAMMALASARLATGIVSVLLAAMANEHERAVGGWQAEWVAIPNLFRHTSGAVARVRNLVSELRVNPDRMKQNLELNGGVLMAESLTVALAPHLGRPEAQQVVQAACNRALSTSSTLSQAALEDPQSRVVLTSEAIQRALDPAGYSGSAGAFIDRALDAYRQAHSAVEDA